MRLFISLSTTTLLLGCWINTANACPGCAPVLTPTWSERYAQSDVALLTRWVSAQAGSIEKKTKARTVFEVLQVAKQTKSQFKNGQRIELPKYIEGEADESFVLTGRRAVQKLGSDPTLKWDAPEAISETAYQYILQAPSPEEPVEKRLKFFLKFFEFPDQLVADDAYNEFAKAPFKHVKAIADVFPRKKLRTWLVDPNIKQNRTGLYGLMLGLCGTKDDVVLLESIIVKNEKKFRLGLEGVIAGYLMLVGEKGMNLIERTRLRGSDTEPGDMYVAVQALRIIDTYSPDSVGRDRLKKAFHLVLERPVSAELVIADLARWKDWAIMDRLVTLYDKKDYANPGFRVAVIKFLLAAGRDLPRGAKEPPPHVERARKHLEAIKKKDPKNYRFALRVVF